LIYFYPSNQQAGLNSFPFVWIGNPNSILINGKGIAPECLPDGVNFNNANACLETCQGSTLDLLETITVEVGKTYRLRIINSAQLVMLNFAIAGHSLTIVQVEGTNTEPRTVESFDISPGQRFDVLFTANQDPGSYWIQTSVRERNILDVKGNAILQYAGSSATVPATLPVHPAWDDSTFGEMQQDSLKSLDASSDPEAVALNATNIKRYVLVGTQNGK
jgi:FtsP/CotA-like multicopper oxidase with cupredoxin domain